MHVGRDYDPVLYDDTNDPRQATIFFSRDYESQQRLQCGMSMCTSVERMHNVCLNDSCVRKRSVPLEVLKCGENYITILYTWSTEQFSTSIPFLQHCCLSQ